MVRIPVYETKVDAAQPQSRVRPQLQTGASAVFDNMAQVAENAGQIAATIREKHTKIRNDEEFYENINKLQKGDPDNNIPGLNELFTTASSSSDFQNALTNYDTSSKEWINTLSQNISNEAVKQRFNIRASEISTGYYLQAERSIYQNARQSYLGTIKEQVNNDINNFIVATNTNDTYGASIAHDNLFGKIDKDGNMSVMSYGQRLEDKGMLPDGTTAKQYDDNVEAALEATYAADLVENNPAQFFKLDDQQFFDTIAADKLVALRAKAKDNLRNQTINQLLTFYPIDGNRDFEESQKMFDEASKGNFANNETLQNLYNSLDQEGKNIFQEAIGSRHNQQKAEINATRANNQFREQEANKEIFESSLETVNTTLTISEINSKQWIGTEGLAMQQQLTNLVTKREAGELPTDANLQMYNQIFPLVVDKKITSVTEPFALPNENTPKSIMERTGGQNGLGYNQFATFAQLISNRNNPDILKQEKDFQDFISAYQAQILGSPALLQNNTFADARYFDFTLAMRAAYNNGLAQGKTPTELLVSTSPDFILRDITPYIPSNDEMMKELMNSMIPQEQMPESLVEWRETAPQKPADMTFEDFQLTDEYIEWIKRKPVE